MFYLRAMMRAYRMTAWASPPGAVEIDVPSVGPGQILVRVAGCGLCHSDLTMRHIPAAAGAHLGWAIPFTLGHETAGHIAALGPGVTGFAEGEAVALVSPTSCGSCWYCVRGLDSACPNGRTGRGYGRDGGLADYVLVQDSRSLLPLRSLDPATAGPLTDAGATAFHAVRRALRHIPADGTAVVLGAGGLGSFAVQFLSLLTTAQVVAIDTNPDRLDYARSIGAHQALAGVDEDTVAQIRQLTGGRGADAVLDFVGVDATIAAGVASVRPGGAYGLIGAAGGTLGKPWFGSLPKDGEIYTFQGSTIADAQEVIALADAGLIRSAVEPFTFEQIDDAYARLEAGTLRGRAVVVLADAPDASPTPA
jgi:propanol-preferring alcohol dehydrogenase